MRTQRGFVLVVLLGFGCGGSSASHQGAGGASATGGSSIPETVPPLSLVKRQRRHRGRSPALAAPRRQAGFRAAAVPPRAPGGNTGSGGSPTMGSAGGAAAGGATGQGGGGAIDAGATSAGNPYGSCSTSVPATGEPADPFRADDLFRDGSPVVLSVALLQAAATKGGIITFDCGPAPYHHCCHRHAQPPDHRRTP